MVAAVIAVIAAAGIVANLWVVAWGAKRFVTRAFGIVGIVFFAFALWRSGILVDSQWHKAWSLVSFATLIVVIAVPPLMAVLLVRWGLRRPSGSFAWLIQQNVALAVVLILLLQLLPESPTSTNAQLIESAVQPVAMVSPPVRQLDDPLISLEALDQSGARMPREDWEVTARGETLADGVDAAFALVRDEIAYEPYAGVLRGAWGCYVTRAGNAVDRTLLLAGLLAVKNVSTRFVTGTLDAATRERLLDRVFETHVTLAERPADLGGFPQRVLARAEGDYARVRAAVGERLRPVTSPTRDEVLADINPHVWLQADVNGTWLDLDPSFSDARPGMVYAAAAQTLSEVPADLYQVMTIRLIGEYISEARTSMRPFLEVTRRSVDVIDQQIAVVHNQPQGFGGLGLAIGGAIGQKKEVWRPLLSIGGDLSSGGSFDVSDPNFVAEWLEFELAWPGGRRETTRRLLVDRAPDGWRDHDPPTPQTLRPLERDDAGAVSMQAIHNIWFSASQHDLRDYNLAVREALLELLQVPSADQPNGDLGQSIWHMARANFAATIWTDHVSLPMVNATPGVRLFADSPRIAVFSAVPSVEGGTERITDLRRDGLRGIAATGRELELAEAKLRFGIMQGAMEHELAAESAVALYGSAAQLSSTSSLLASEPLRVRIDERRLLVSGASDSTQARWEIAIGTGDSYAIGDTGLHSVRDKPMKGIKQGAPSPKSYTIDTRSPKKKAMDEAAENLARARNKPTTATPPKPTPPPAPSQARPEARGGGSEYAVVLLIGTIAKMAIWVMTTIAEALIYQEIEKAIDWIRAGGFSRAVEGWRNPS